MILSIAKEQGYNCVIDGTNFDDISDYRPGLKALKELDSCASGVSVVNIDNGFGAAYNASIINKL